MSAVEFVRRLLEARWEHSIDGRPHDVPQPAIIENTADVKRRLNTEDVMQISAPGSTQINPQTFREVEWTDEITVAVRAAERANAGQADHLTGVHGDPYKRMFGTRDENNEAYRWPGITGEVLRILFSVYRGHKEFDKITPPTVDDLSDQTGPNNARAEITVDLEQIAVDTNNWEAII